MMTWYDQVCVYWWFKVIKKDDIEHLKDCKIGSIEVETQFDKMTCTGERVKDSMLNKLNAFEGLTTWQEIVLWAKLLVK